MALTAVSLAAAAQQYGVKCQLNDTTGSGEPYATARIYLMPDTAKVLTTGVTDGNGAFSQSLSRTGSYRIRFSSVGKTDATATFTITKQKPEANLGTMVIRDNGNMLNAVTVTAQKPLVTTEIDRISYDMQADEESKTKNVMDMLRKVPMVSVDGQDNITVRGSSDFKIYKNGHPDPSLSGHPKEVLKAIPANMVKKIEVITEPGAKYDAEGVGAILNIVMVGGSSINGVAGTLNAGANQHGGAEAGAYITTQIGKVVASVNYGYDYNNLNGSNRQMTRTETRYKKSGESTTIDNAAGYKINVHYGNIDASWEPDTLNLMTMSLGGYFYSYRSNSDVNAVRFNADGSPVYRYGAHSTTIDPMQYYSLDGHLDFQHKTHRKGEALTLSYMLSNSRSNSKSSIDYTDELDMPIDYTRRISTGRERFIEHTVQLDWARPFAQHHKVETGLKYINRLNHSRSAYTHVMADGSQSDLDSNIPFDHRTQVGAAYGSYTYSSGKWSTRAGLRYEFSHLAAHYPNGAGTDYSANLSDWVPTASVSYQISQANSLKWAFTTRINRPGINYLNPAVDNAVESISHGNPDLNSAHSYSTSLTFMHIGRKITYNVVPGFTFSNNAIGEVRGVSDDGKTTSTYGNVNKALWAGVSGYAQWTPFSKTSIMVSGNVGYQNIKSNELGLSNDGAQGNVYGNLSQQLPLGLRLSAYGGWNSSNVSSLYGENGNNGWYGASLQWSGSKDKRLTVALSATNLFDKYKRYTTRITQGDYTEHNSTRYSSRFINLSISYRFGSLKASVKKTDTSIKNNDLVGGSSKGGGTGAQK